MQSCGFLEFFNLKPHFKIWAEMTLKIPVITYIFNGHSFFMAITQLPLPPLKPIIQESRQVSKIALSNFGKYVQETTVPNKPQGQGLPVFSGMYFVYKKKVAAVSNFSLPEIKTLVCGIFKTQGRIYMLMFVTCSY